MADGLQNISPEEINTTVCLEDVQKEILQRSQKQLESLDIVDPAEQEVIIAQFMSLGNAIINDYLNKK